MFFLWGEAKSLIAVSVRIEVEAARFSAATSGVARANSEALSSCWYHRR